MLPATTLFILLLNKNIKFQQFFIFLCLAGLPIFVVIEALRSVLLATKDDVLLRSILSSSEIIELILTKASLKEVIDIFGIIGQRVWNAQGVWLVLENSAVKQDILNYRPLYFSEFNSKSRSDEAQFFFKFVPMAGHAIRIGLPADTLYLALSFSPLFIVHTIIVTLVFKVCWNLTKTNQSLRKIHFPISIVICILPITFFFSTLLLFAIKLGYMKIRKQNFA